MSVTHLRFINLISQYHFSQMIAKVNTLKFFKSQWFKVKSIPLPPPPFRNSHMHMEMIGFNTPGNSVEKNLSSNRSAKKIP